MADLTVTITDEVKIEGKNKGNTSIQLITGINDVYNRIITIPVTETNVYSTDRTLVSGSTLDEDLIKYARITNKDATNFVTLRISNDDNDEVLYKLGAGETFVLYNHASSLDAIDNAVQAIASEGSIKDITAIANTLPCKLDVLVASA